MNGYDQDGPGYSVHCKDKRHHRRSHVPRAVRRFSVLSGVALCAVLGGPIAVAQASDNTLRQTLNSFGPKIVKDEKAINKGVNGYVRSGAKPLVKAVTHEVGDLHKLTSKLSAEPASSARGRKAKKEIIKGLGLIANAYVAYRSAIQAARGGTVSVARVGAAQKIRNKGHAKLVAGLKLLST
jgi:hypothetical protein